MFTVLNLLMVEKKSSRRMVLKIGASALAASSIPTVVGAVRPDGEKRHEQARQMMRGGASAAERERFLRKHNIPVVSKYETYYVPAHKGNEHSTDSQSNGGQQNGEIDVKYLDQPDLQIYLSLTEISSGRWSSFIQWNWADQDYDDWGDPPKDFIAINWNKDHYNWYNDEVYCKDDYRVGLQGYDKFTDYTDGFTWWFNDSKGDGGANFWAEVIVYYDEYVNPDERYVHGAYTHTWNSNAPDEIWSGSEEIIKLIWGSDGGQSWISQSTQAGMPLRVSPTHDTAN